MWYQALYIDFGNFDNFFEFMFTNPTVKGMENVTEEMLGQMKSDAEKLYNERMGPDVEDPKGFEALIIKAFKK